jgi:sigma-E factor negative regulatory protein RseB
MTHADRLIITFGGLLIAAIVQAEGSAPHQWLDRMNDAVRQLDYEGRYIVQSGDHLDALYLVHRVDDGVEKERIVSLTGEPREIIRSDEAVACLIPGRGRHINVGRRPLDRSFSPLNGVSGEQLARSYRMKLLDRELVAGRETQEILIEPRDNFRYGYRLFVDIQTGLPLRSLIFDESHRTVSQMMFVEIRVNEAITPIERDLSAMQMARADRLSTLPHERLAPPAWHVAELPPGYQLNAHRRRAAESGELEHFIFSDGLATFSLYVQPAAADGLSGESRFGAANAVGRVVDGHEVIVVGEVPLTTLRWVSQHVEPVAR